MPMLALCFKKGALVVASLDAKNRFPLFRAML
jgi:hypothetical protein